jgi:catechol 1,2-dioxygenase
MIIRTLDDVTADALAAMQQTVDPRLREIMISLVKHLHGFIRDVGLTEPEFRHAAAILNEMGKLTSDTHNRACVDGRIVGRFLTRLPPQ